VKPLRQQLLIRFLPLSVLPLLIISVIFLFLTLQNFKTESKQKLISSIRGIELEIEIVLEELLENAVAITTNQDFKRALLKQDTVTLRGYLERSTLQPGLDIARLMGPKRKIIVEANNPLSHNHEKLPETSLYKEAFSGRIATGIERTETGIGLVTLLPFYHQKRLLAVLELVHLMDYEFLSRLKDQSSLEITLYDNARLQATTFSNPSFLNSVDFINMKNHKNRETDLSSVRLNLGGIPFYGISKPILSGDLRIGTLIMAYSIQEASDKLSWALLLGGGSILGLMALVFIACKRIASKITLPLEQLSLSASGIAEGDMSKRVSVDSSNEVGLLGSSFNRMAETIEYQMEKLNLQQSDLEEKVRQRTDMLHQSNTALASEIDKRKSREIDLQLAKDTLEKRVLERTALLEDEIVRRKKGEEVLALSENRFRTIFRLSNDPILLIDMDNGKIIDFNQKAYTDLGYTYDEFKGLNIWDFKVIPKEAVKQNMEHLRKQRHETFETQHRTKEGSIRDILVSTRVMVLEKKEVLLSVYHDITTMKKTEASLRLSSKVFEVASEAILITDADQKIISANPAFESITGYSTREIIGKTPRMFKSVKHDKVFFEQMWKKINTTGLWQGEIWDKKKNGGIYPKWTSITAVKDKEGNTVQYISLFTDITDWKKIEKKLLQIQKVQSIGQIAGGVAHEFNNLLTPIIGYVDIIRKKTQELPEVQEHLITVQKAALRASMLTNDLLAYSRKAPVDLQSQSLLLITDEVLSLLRQTIDRRIKLTLESENDLCPVLMDTGQIHQVVMNLCLNARDALKELLDEDNGSRPFIRIKIKNVHLNKAFCKSHPGTKTGDSLCLSVSDNGSGIDENILPQIYDPFFTTKDVGQGTGLGLSSSYGIIKGHQGWIGVTTQPGKGSTFEIYLPCSKHLIAKPARGKTSPEDRHGTETILLVDDDEQIRDLGKIILEDRGYKVLLAEGGNQALEIFGENHGAISAVVLDLTMPHISGWDVFRRLRRSHPALKVIICSGHDISGQINDMKDLEPFQVLQKPYPPSELGRVVQETLDQGRGMVANT